MTETLILNSTEFGNTTQAAPPVLILHGLFGSSRNWQTFAQHLSRDHQVFTLDLRNHGNSPHSDSMSYTLMAADVVRFMDDNNIPRACLIGHSMGGKTAMSLALQNPDRVAHLVVVDIAPVAYDHNYEELLGKLTALDMTQIQRRADANKLLGEKIDDDELRLFLLQNLIVKPGETSRWRINLAGIHANVNHLVQYVPAKGDAKFSAPVDVIRGALSHYVNEKYFSAFERFFPTVNFHTIENAGHWPHAQNAEAFLTKVRQIFSAYAPG